jgi:HlyD family secretion protein
VLLVPNTALRFTPAIASGGTAGAAAKPAPSGGIMSQLMPRMPRSDTRRPGGSGEAADSADRGRKVWVLKDGAAHAVAVQVGISDGRRTEVSGEGLAEGMAVITDQRSAGAAP